MKKIKVSVLYNRAKADNTTLLFDSTDKDLIPEMVDEDENILDNDFITYYINNSDIFDRYVRNMHGRKIYSMYDEDLEDLTELECWKAEIKEQLLINMYEFAGDYAKAMQKFKMQIGADLKVVENLGATEVTSDYGAKHSEDTYGEDVTTSDYGAQSGSSQQGLRSSTSVNSDKTYESGLLEDVEKVTNTAQPVTDTSSAAAHQDIITRDLKTDEHDENSHSDKVSGKAVENTTTTYNDLDYYKNMAQYPEFEAIIKRIINKVVIGMGVSYEY